MILQFFTVLWPQNAEITVTVAADKVPGITVRAHFQNTENLGAARTLSFPTQVAGINLPNGRVTEIRLTAQKGSLVQNRELIPGEFLAEGDFTEVEYKIALPIPKENRAAAHISWIGPTGGVLMLSDLIPLIGGRRIPFRLKLNLPDGWEVYSQETRLPDSAYAVQDSEKAVLLIGTGLRTLKGIQNIKGAEFEIALAGEWLFSDAEAAGMISDIETYYKKMLGNGAGPFRVNILKFPGGARPGIWEAETRGRTITILSSDMPFRSQSIQRLHEQLRHELFHLWIPNGLRLKGNYDWFYEGFTLYIALKAGVMTNQIGFRDFLDTITRAKNIDDRSTQPISLVAESENRWNGGETRIYARGMAAAFLADVRMLAASGGKKSIETLYRRLVQTYRLPGPEVEGGKAILELLRTNPELLPVIDKYITGADPIDWREALLAAGIEDTGENGRSRLSVVTKPSGRQKTILDKLGYNNWRKLSPVKK